MKSKLSPTCRFAPTRAAVAAAAATGWLALFAGPAANAQTLTTTGLSGQEIYPGKRVGEVTKGVVMLGTDNPVCNCWTDVDSGGHWVAVVDRTGHAGLGSQISVVGGRWLWVTANDVARFGKILDGTVTWPADLTSDLGCGPGVARFATTVTANGQATTGTFTGCLDDTHLPFVFPPKIWGTLSF